MAKERSKNKSFVTEEGARTLDHKVKSLALYQLSYSGPCLICEALGLSQSEPGSCDRLLSDPFLLFMYGN